MKTKLFCTILLLATMLITACPNLSIKGKVAQVKPKSANSVNYATIVVFDDGREHEFKVISEAIVGKECIIQYTRNDDSMSPTTPDYVTHLDCE